MGKSLDPLKVLRSYVAQHSTQAAAADALDISAPYLSDILAGKRGFSQRVLTGLGLRRVRTVIDTYRKAA